MIAGLEHQVMARSIVFAALAGQQTSAGPMIGGASRASCVGEPGTRAGNARTLGYGYSRQSAPGRQRHR